MEEYENFDYSGINVKILKGKDLTKNEIKSRLHRMEINFDLNKKDKQYFINLYDKAIFNDFNKLKIFDELQIDTIQLYNKNNIKKENNRKTFFAENNELRNFSTNKKNINEKKPIINNEVKPSKKANNYKNINNRNDNNYFNENNKSYFTNALANQIIRNSNDQRINAFKYNMGNNQNSDMKYEQDMKNSRNNEPKIDLRNRPNNYSNSYYNINNKYSINDERKIEDNKKYRSYFQENNTSENNKEHSIYNNSFIFDNNINNNEMIASNIIFDDLENKLDKESKNNNYYNYNSNNDYEKEEYIKKQKISYSNPNLIHNYHYYYNPSDNNNNRSYMNEKGNYMNEFQHEIENKNNIKIPINNNYNNAKAETKYRRPIFENINEDNSIEEEEVQNNQSNNDNKFNIDLLLYILFLVTIGFFIHFVYKVFSRIGNTVTQAATETINIVSNPRRLFRDIILGFIKAILMGICYEYLHITLPLAILYIVIYKYKKWRNFHKLCKEIIKDIKKELENKKNKSWNQKEIVDYYSKKYNIDKNTFLKKYLIQLDNLRKKDHALKLSSNINSKGEIETLWELSN